MLVDAQAFPRDKVCGDGLIPDAHRALARLGVLDEVMAEAQSAASLGCIAPRGGRIDVPGGLAVLPRKRLDEIVCRAAVDAGARMFAPARFVGAVRDGDRRASSARALQDGDACARCARPGSCSRAARSRRRLLAAGMCERRTPSGIALRGYVENAAMTPRITSLEVVWHKRLAPGYGWIFPCRGGVFNIGVGIAAQPRRAARRPAAGMKDANLRDVFDAFKSRLRAGARARRGRRWRGEPGRLKGAPLRCTLEGARFDAPGVLVTGEAAGSTYSFTGEGIGKAMETGIHAAEAIARRGRRRRQRDDAAVRADYEARVLALKPRFELYERPTASTSHPWLVDLLIWSARRSPRRLQRMAGVLEETHIPTDAVTFRGVVRRLFDWR